VALTNTIGSVLREPVNDRAHPDRWYAGAYGELIIGGGTAFSSAANPSAEVVDGTGVTLGRQFRVAGTIASGKLVPQDEGDYLVEFELYDTSDQTASGNVQWDVQYAPDGTTFAAFSATETAGGGGRMQAIRAAATAKKGIRLAKVQRLVANSAVRAVVTSAAGDAITITEGALRITKLADSDPPSQ
jgi:hypothetical protein